MRTIKLLKKQYLLAVLLLLSGAYLQAQVTVGADSVPLPFSALELISNQARGLRLPQLTTAQQTTLAATTEFQTKKAGEAKGLMIFNTDTKSVNTWNGDEWIEEHAQLPTVQNGWATVNFTDGSPGRYGTMKAVIPGDAVIRWYTPSGILIPELTGESEFDPQADLSSVYKHTNPGIYTYHVEAYQNGYTTAQVPVTYTVCGAKDGSNNWIIFMCHNLGADQTIDPLTPAAGLSGARYRFGVQYAAYSMAADQSNSGTITNWTTNSHISYPFVNVVDWLDNDPCKQTVNGSVAGWRLPTNSEWLAITANNGTPVRTASPWLSTSFENGVYLGNYLFLPTTGYRDPIDGSLIDRNTAGHYWSSSKSTTNPSVMGHKWYFRETPTSIGSANSVRSNGFAVRCIAE